MTEAPANAEDFAAARRELRDLAAAIRASHVGHVQTVNMPQPQRAERLAWAMFGMVAVMGVLAGGAIVAAVLQGQRVTDLRADMHAERQRREAHASWAREEAQIIRSYIWAGKVPPANAYPKEADE